MDCMTTINNPRQYNSIFLSAEAHYQKAVDGYTKAILLDPNKAVYYANRAAAHIRLESFGSALADATKAIELDPKYIKVHLTAITLQAC